MGGRRMCIDSAAADRRSCLLLRIVELPAKRTNSCASVTTHCLTRRWQKKHTGGRGIMQQMSPRYALRRLTYCKVLNDGWELETVITSIKELLALSAHLVSSIQFLNAGLVQ